MIKNEIMPILRRRFPGQLVIQYTDKCNALCPQCGMRKTNNFLRSTLGIDTVKRIIDHAANSGVIALSFTGGEPLIYLNDIVELIKYAGDAGIRYVRTGTNGFLFKGAQEPDFTERITEIAQKLTETKLYTFWISIDSADSVVHEDMRGLNGVVEGIKKALPIFHKHGLYPAANLGINRNIADQKGVDISQRSDYYNAFKEGFRNFYQHVINMGFTMTNACYPMSIDPEEDDSLHAVYGATSESNVVSFTSEEKEVIFQALFDTIPEYRSKIRIFSPRVSLFSLIKQYNGEKETPYPCRGGVDFFFIDAHDGNTYPCGYRGNDSFGKFWDIDLKTVKEQRQCRDCDWECFRDPSELFGPFLSLSHSPLETIKKFISEREFLKLWYKDLTYFRACEYFNGRNAPNMKKLLSFSSNGGCG